MFQGNIRSIIISASLIVLPSVTVLVNCGFNSDGNLLKSGDNSPRNSNLSISYYNAGDFNMPNGAFVAVSPGVDLGDGKTISCTDNFYVEYLKDGKFTDVEDADVKDLMTKRNMEESLKSDEWYVDQAIQACGCDEISKKGGACNKDEELRCITRKESGGYLINKPNCSLPDSVKGKTYELTIENNKQKIDVTIQTTCPDKHWKNLAKKSLQIDDGHCLNPHVDISQALKSEERYDYLGLKTFSQSDVTVSLKPKN